MSRCIVCNHPFQGLPCPHCGYTGKANYDYEERRDYSEQSERLNKEASDAKDLAIATRFANRIRLAIAVLYGGAPIGADGALAMFRSERPDKQRAILDLARFLEAKP